MAGDEPVVPPSGPLKPPPVDKAWLEVEDVRGDDPFDDHDHVGGRA
ncbi:hypothetical protein JNUCC0626_14295 [Lentzea sp. JNUCC 0626]